MNWEDREHGLREAARYLRQYANSEMDTRGSGLREPSVISSTVALICRNIATRLDEETSPLARRVAEEKERVLAEARKPSHDGPLGEAIRRLEAAEEELSQANIREAVRRLRDRGQRHADDCKQHIAANGAVAFECEHGYDCCPICDPCTCGAAP